MIPIAASWTLKNKFGLGLYSTDKTFHMRSMNFNPFSLYCAVGLTVVCTVYTITFLKLWSYIHVNFWCRRDGRSSKSQRRRRALSVTHPSNAIRLRDKQNEWNSSRRFFPGSESCNGDVSNTESIVEYPNNLTIGDLYYFMAVPSLCYELNFPRTSRIRKRFLIKRIIEVILGMQVTFGLFQQWIIPSVKNSLNPFSVFIIYFHFKTCTFTMACSLENGVASRHGALAKTRGMKHSFLNEHINHLFLMHRFLTICCGSFGSTCAFTRTSTCSARYWNSPTAIFMATGGTLRTSTSSGDRGTCPFTGGQSGNLILHLNINQYYVLRPI